MATKLTLLLAVITLMIAIATSKLGFQLPPLPEGNNANSVFTIFGTAVDHNDNFVFVGLYNANVPGYPSVTTETGFISKYHSNGTLIWAINPHYTPQNPGMVDSNGDVYANGFLQEAAGIQYVFAKYNGADGEVIWERLTAIIENFTDADTYIATDDEGNLYGYAPYSGTVDFLDANNVTVGFAQGNLLSQDNFVVKYNTTGDFQWAVSTFSNEGAIITAQFIIANRTTGDVYPIGSYANCSGCTFDTHLLVDNSGTNNVFAFILKIDSNGTAHWLNTIEAEQVLPAADAVDSEGSVVVTGSWLSTNLSLTVNNTSLAPSNTTSQAFLARFSELNGTIEYLQSTRSQGDTTAQSIDCGDFGECWFTGQYQADKGFKFGGIDLQSNSSAPGTNQVYFVKADHTGQGVKGFSGSGPNATFNRYALLRALKLAISGHISPCPQMSPKEGNIKLQLVIFP